MTFRKIATLCLSLPLFLSLVHAVCAEKKSVDFVLEGVTWESSSRVRLALDSVSGVYAVKMNLGKRITTVFYDDLVTQVDTLRTAIRETGHFVTDEEE